MKKELVKVRKPNSLLVGSLVLLSLLGVVSVGHEAVHVSNLGTHKEGNAHNDINAEVSKIAATDRVVSGQCFARREWVLALFLREGTTERLTPRKPRHISFVRGLHE